MHNFTFFRSIWSMTYHLCFTNSSNIFKNWHKKRPFWGSVAFRTRWWQWKTIKTVIWSPTWAKKLIFFHFLNETICKTIENTPKFDYMQKEWSYMQKKWVLKWVYAKENKITFEQSICKKNSFICKKKLFLLKSVWFLYSLEEWTIELAPVL